MASCMWLSCWWWHIHVYLCPVPNRFSGVNWVQAIAAIGRHYGCGRTWIQMTWRVKHYLSKVAQISSAKLVTCWSFLGAKRYQWESHDWWVTAVGRPAKFCQTDWGCINTDLPLYAWGWHHSGFQHENCPGRRQPLWDTGGQLLWPFTLAPQNHYLITCCNPYFGGWNLQLYVLPLGAHDVRSISAWLPFWSFLGGMVDPPPR